MSWDGRCIESSYADEIHRLFDSRANELQMEQSIADENINSWARMLHMQIQKHVKEQKDLLEYYYNERQFVLLEKRRRTIDEMRRFYAQNAYDQINDLLNQCRCLKLELLVRFTFEPKEIQFIHCATKEHLEPISANAENSNHREVVSSTYSPTNSLAGSVFASGSQTTQPLRATNNTGGHVHLSRGNDNQYCDTNVGHTYIDECPVCLMHFPSRMTLTERETHVSVHSNNS